MVTSRFRQASGPWLVVWWLLLAAGYAALAEASMLLADPFTHVSLLWLPAGLALAALLRFGLRLWPGVALGAMGAELLRHTALLPGVAFAVAATVEVLLAAWLVRRLIDHAVVLQHIGDVLRFILATVIAPLAAALIAGAAFAGDRGWGDLLQVMPRWWLGNVAGMLIVAPFVLGWSGRAYAPPAGRGGELALFVAIACGVADLVFSGRLPAGSLVFNLLGFFLWAGLRLEVRGMSALNLTVALFSVYYTSRGLGPFMAHSVWVRELTVQAFAVTAAVSGLLLIAAMHERAEAFEELRLSARIIDASPEHIAVVTPEHIYRRANEAHLRAHGRLAQAVDGRHVAELLGRDVYQQLVRPNLERAFAGAEVRYNAWFNYTGAGRRHMLVAYLPLVNGNDHQVESVAMLSRDITDIKEAEEKLQLAASVIENTPEGVMITDANQRIVSVNPAFVRNTGYSVAEVVGQNPSLLASGRHDRAFYQRMWSAINERGSWQGEIWNRRKNGDIYVEWLSVVAIRDADGAVSHYAGLFSDITTQEHVRNRLHSLAYYDALTDLPNRELFNDRLESALAQARREPRMVGVMFLDLDHFKQINDSLGHFVGDELLKVVADILGRCIRESDTVARLGGDEFTILMAGITLADDVTLVAQKIVEALDHPLTVAGHELRVTASIGTAIFPADGADGEMLLRNADAAMYAAKQSGRNQFRPYRPSAG